MKLSVSTPLAVIADVDDVAYLRAEDETGAFGILPGHADFLSALAISVMSWRDAGGAEHHLALRGGMIEVRGGDTVSVATREAVAGDDLEKLQTEVLTAFRRGQEEEKAAHTDAQRLYLAAIRQICLLLRPDRASRMPTGAGAERFGEAEQ